MLDIGNEDSETKHKAEKRARKQEQQQRLRYRSSGEDIHLGGAIDIQLQCREARHTDS
jgi:hypothetical protein